MMTQRQAAFRADYRTRISPWYSGLGHVLVIAALGLATIWYCARNVNQPTTLEWLVVPAAFLASNIFEWAMHRFIMHRPVKGLMGIYKRHTPFMNTIRRHHIAHHDQAIMMSTNMNLTYPFADWLFGTSDLERGLLGHLFNGYDSRFRKRNLKKVRATAADSRLAPAE